MMSVASYAPVAWVAYRRAVREKLGGDNLACGRRLLRTLLDVSLSRCSCDYDVSPGGR